MLTVFGLALPASWDDATYLLRRPTSPMRAVLSLNVVMPIVAALFAATHRSAHARRQDPAQGDEGRLVPARTELLSPLPPRRADAAGDRHVDVSPWFPLHRTKP